ncbi:MAG TPA: hypothetical protein VKD69_07450 [Vicinamibacterales bacterium]|nr:hypothetical protein [Vicinamibacterales bacterium]
MPMPPSVTLRVTSVSVASRLMRTVPPRSVNFTSFEIRFQMTCWRRSGSADTGGGCAATL